MAWRSADGRSWLWSGGGTKRQRQRSAAGPFKADLLDVMLSDMLAGGSDVLKISILRTESGVVHLAPRAANCKVTERGRRFVVGLKI